MTRIPVLLVAGVLVLALSSCAGAGGPATHTTADAGHTSTPTPSASAGPTQDPADPATWIISAEGVGPVRLGEKVTDTVAAIPGYSDVSDPNDCPNPRTHYVGPAGSTPRNAPLLLVADESGALVGVALTAAGPKTLEGIGVGSTEASVKAAYPTAVPGTRQPGSPPDLVTVHGQPGWISYEYTVEDAPVVQQVDLISGGLPPYEFCG